MRHATVALIYAGFAEAKVTALDPQSRRSSAMGECSPEELQGSTGRRFAQAWPARDVGEPVLTDPFDGLGL